MSNASIHPFPARMAPELAEGFLDRLADHSTVLDPMMGSGSFPLAAARRGHRAIGSDTDPLAVLIAQTAASHFDTGELLDYARKIVSEFTVGDYQEHVLGKLTGEFINFWFDSETRDKLAGLVSGIKKARPELRPALWSAFSRLIITKDNGASKARDVSHSRPHRVRETASFDVVEKFLPSVSTVARRLEAQRSPGGGHPAGESHGSFTPLRSDGRRIPLAPGTVDAVMTSPPYLVAIDYLRGHRMSLVWMGYDIEYLRELRGTNIGSCRGGAAESEVQRVQELATSGVLATKDVRLVNRYVSDMWGVIAEISRVLKAGGGATFVIADARLKGASISVEKIVTELCSLEGLGISSRACREIPANRRYLPPPRSSGKGLDLRMREEVILGFTN
ncbi:TRM11 family methyltransferase [Streptomyces ardesiacus]|uniref:hypothetical protein n=1 Tax=Streptomyces ardesiacus TaxID=285564 RepID=UPI0036CD249C